MVSKTQEGHRDSTDSVYSRGQRHTQNRLISIKTSIQSIRYRKTGSGFALVSVSATKRIQFPKIKGGRNELCVLGLL